MHTHICIHLHIHMYMYVNDMKIKGQLFRKRVEGDRGKGQGKNMVRIHDTFEQKCHHEAHHFVQQIHTNNIFLSLE